MKVKSLSLFVLIIFAFTGAKAQILIGPVVGPQISWVSFDDKDNAKLYKQKPVYGFHAGAGISFRVQKRFFLNTTILYSTKGKTLEGKEDGMLLNKARYNFLEMPVTYTAEFITHAGSGKQFKWYLGLGPNISYLLKGKGSLETSSLNEILIYRINYKLVYNKPEDNVADDEMNVREANRFQLGLNITAGLVFEPLGLQKVMVTMRYEAGSSFYSRSNQGSQLTRAVDYTDDFKIRNQGFRLSLAYLIDLKTDQRKKGKSTINKKKLREAK
jgi:Outer membrane protein beta-barrel domain